MIGRAPSRRLRWRITISREAGAVRAIGRISVVYVLAACALSLVGIWGLASGYNPF
jgi:hypothetical protein